MDYDGMVGESFVAERGAGATSSLLAAQPLVEVQTLGEFTVTVRGRRVTDGAWQRRKARQLFKCVLTQPDRRLLKDQVVELLWPDSDALAGPANLRSATHAARRALATAASPLLDEVLGVDRDSVFVRGQAVVWVDADAARDALGKEAAASAFAAGAALSLEEAVAHALEASGRA